MKKKIPLILIVVLLFSCRKSQMKEEIAGTWELERYDGYLFQRPPPPPGNGNIIMLWQSGKFERWRHDTLIFRGVYHLKKKKDCAPRESEMLFKSNDPGTTENYVYLADEKLAFTSPACYSDGGTTYYRRIK